MLDVRPDDAGRGLGAERPGLSVLRPRSEPEELLLDDVRCVADPALEDRRLLEQRRLDRVVAVAGRETPGDRFEPKHRRPLGRQEVPGAPRGAEGGHRRLSLAAGRGRRPGWNVQPAGHGPYDPAVGPSGVPIRGTLGYLGGIAIGTMSITLLFLGMRAVMDVGGACADGGPYQTAQPCPTGVPLAMIGGMFGLFGAAGLIMWFGSQLGGAAASIVALGWPALFIALGWNFLDYAFHPPDVESAPIWGWLIPGILFWIMGGAPLAIGLAAWRAARGGGTANRVSLRMLGGLSMTPRGLAGQAATGSESGTIAVPTDPAARRVDDRSFTSTEFAPTHATALRRAGDELVDDLAELARLHADGSLTDDEFSAAKRERLAEAERGR